MAVRAGALEAYTVTLAVRDAYSQPISNAITWFDINAPKSARTDGTGTATISSVTGGVYLAVARHQNYGRADARQVTVTSNMTVTFQLPPQTTFRIGTYNTMGYDSWSDSQIKPLARILWTVQPDIMTINECPNSGTTFPQFVRIFLPGYTNVVSIYGGPLHNGILSFFPLTNTASFGAGAPMIRDVFTSIVRTPQDMPLTIACVHFKAGSTVSDAEQRLEESAYTGQLCSNWYTQGRLVWLSGDFNDDPANPILSTNVHTILHNAGARLVELDPRDDGGSTVTWPPNSRLDYLSPVSNIAVVVVAQRVFRTETMTNRPAWLSSGDSAAASDHRLLYADVAVLPEPVAGAACVCCIWFARRRQQTHNPAAAL